MWEAGDWGQVEKSKGIWWTGREMAMKGPRGSGNAAERGDSKAERERINTTKANFVTMCPL